MLSHSMRDGATLPETRPPPKPKFHKNHFWEHAGRDPSSDKAHGLFCPHKLEQGLSWALNLCPRSSSSPASSEQAAGPNKRVRLSGASEASPLSIPIMDLTAPFVDAAGWQEIVQFRKLKLPSSESYDGSAERPVRPALFKTTSSLYSQGTDVDPWVDSRGEWNIPKLLGLSDTIRATLAQGKKLSFAEVEDLNFVLDMMVVDELDDDTAQRITFPAVQRARLDELLADVLRACERATTTHGLVVETGLGSETDAASRLQKHWQSRFQSEYAGIEKYRFDILRAESLQDVTFSAVASDGLGVWVPKEATNEEISVAEGNTQFIPGHWWLNMGCAHRDGIVGAALEKPTKGRYGMAALALLTGMEQDLPDGKTVYIREGAAHEMHPSLITLCGRKIRILRGFRLKSTRQPRAGVRYDGLYVIHTWSIKLNVNTELYTLRLTLERVPGQRHMDDVLRIPKPSQLDDWKLYEQLERDRIRQTEGKVKFDHWTNLRVAEKQERESWRRSRESPGGQSPQARRRRVSDIETDLLPALEVPEEED